MTPTPSPPSRSVHEVGRGDYVKTGPRWEKIEEVRITDRFNSEGQRSGQEWTVTTASGSHGMWGINRYAKAEDLGT